MPGAEVPLIMCFGDSLTAGFQAPTPDNPEGRSAPYGNRLQELLGTGVRVRVSAVCGELTGEMVLRFRHDVLERRPDYVAILGGTNDLGWNAAPREIMRNLVKLYEQTLAMAGTPIPITVPSIRLDDSSAEARAWLVNHLTRRQQLNGLILDYAASKDLPCVDLFGATVEADTLQLAPTYSNDGIHLTTAGYRVCAERIAEALKPRLSSKGATA